MRTATTFVSFGGTRCLAVVASLAGFLVGCGSGGSPTGGGVGGANPQVGARVIGVVTDGTTGEPVPLVTMRATIFRKNGSCAEQPLGDPFEAATDEEGSYVLNLSLPGAEEFDACVNVEALPPPERPDLPPDLSQSELEIRPWLEGIETITVNFVLRFDGVRDAAFGSLAVGKAQIRSRLHDRLSHR